MLGGGHHRLDEAIASALGWWVEAGVDSWVVEAPRDWLAAPATLPPAPALQPATPDAITAPAPTPDESALPADLAALRTFLAEGAYLPAAPPPRRRVAPEGEAGARLMIVTDMPDGGDFDARRLMARESALLDAMLKALGLDRSALYLAPLSPGRIPGGRIGEARAPLVRLMRHQIALVRPAALLLFGDETCRALFGVERAEACATLRDFAPSQGAAPIPAIATIHPRILRQRPACKADAWAAMRRLLGVLRP